MKKEKGITLVSLVVTIIILIILAGVSINLVLGENGIITKAKEAKEKTEQAKLNEEIALNELYIQMESENSSISYDSIAKLTEFKKEIADYIEEAGGTKPEYTADATTFGDSIKGIVKEVTKDATATAEDIANGKTAYVNGEKIIGIANLNINNEIVGYATKIYYQHKPTSVSISNVLPGTYTLIITSGYNTAVNYQYGDNPATISGCTNKTLKYTSDGSLLCIYEIVMESEGTITITTTGNSGYDNASYISAVIVK